MIVAAMIDVMTGMKSGVRRKRNRYCLSFSTENLIGQFPDTELANPKFICGFAR